MIDFQAAIEEIHHANLEDGSASRLVYATRSPDRRISTLAPGTFRTLSPQLILIYEYIECWECAFLEKDILSLRQIAKAWETDWIAQNIDLKMRNFPTPPGGEADLSKISIFGCAREESDEITLLWGDDEEPRVICYFGASLDSFDDVSSLFDYHLDMSRL